MQQITTDAMPGAEALLPMLTAEPKAETLPRPLNAEQWLAQIPALTRKMATDPVFRAEVEARCV